MVWSDAQMRTLKFIIEGQTIFLDPNCDFSGLEPGTNGYLIAEFTFSKDWDRCTKVAAFFSNLGTEYEPQIINERTYSCHIPAEALSKSIFKVQVIGQRNGYKLCTNKVKVYQKGGKV
jgi:hypothetical protein